MKYSKDLRKDLRFCSYDSLFSSIMIGLGECLLVPFAVAIGMNDAMVGLFSSVPFLFGSAMQLFSPYLLKRVGSFRKFCVVSGLLQALCFIPLAHYASIGQVSHLMVFAIATGYWGFGLATGPVWNSWIGAMMPHRLRPRYFATRNRMGQVGTLFGLLASGLILQFMKGQGLELFAFALLFGSAGFSRLLSVYCLHVQGETKETIHKSRHISPMQLVQKIRSHGDGQLLVFLFIFQIAVNFSSPFFAPFMLKHLQLPYTNYMGLVAASIAAKVFFFPIVGKWCKQHGSYAVMKYGLLAVAILPALWVISADRYYLIFLQLVTGFGWATFDLGCMVATFNTVSDDERTSFLAYQSFANAIAMFVGASAGAHVLTTFGENQHVYYWIFALSAVFRGASFFWLKKAEQAQHSSVVAAKEQVRRAA